MGIRLATAEDVPQLLEMGRAYLAEISIEALGEVEDGPIEDLLLAYVDGASGHIVAVHELAGGRIAGVIIGTLSNIWFAPHKPIAVIQAWWVRPERRGSVSAMLLMAAFCGWAELVGAVGVTSSSIPGGPPAAESVLPRAGFTLMERCWFRPLKGG